MSAPSQNEPWTIPVGVLYKGKASKKRNLEVMIGLGWHPSRLSRLPHFSSGITEEGLHLKRKETSFGRQALVSRGVLNNHRKKRHHRFSSSKYKLQKRRSGGHDWQEVMTRISSFAHLEVGWDGYAAEPISHPVVVQARSLSFELRDLGYSPINADPTGDGSVIMALAKGDARYEVEIVSSTSFGVAKLQAGANLYFDAESLEDVFTILQEEAADVTAA